MEPEFDLNRLRELEAELGTELPTIVTTLLDQLQQAITAIEDGMARGDMAAVALAAHAARNSGLMLDARPMLGALREIEAGARDEQPTVVSAGVTRLRTAWADLRRRLEAEAG